MTAATRMLRAFLAFSCLMAEPHVRTRYHTSVFRDVHRALCSTLQSTAGGCC